MCTRGLADALVAKAVAAGDHALLVEANTVLDKALRHVGPADPDRPIHLNQRAVALRTTFARVGDVAALDDAIGCLRDAVRLVPADGPDRLTVRGDLPHGLALPATELRIAARSVHVILQSIADVGSERLGAGRLSSYSVQDRDGPVGPVAGPAPKPTA